MLTQGPTQDPYTSMTIRLPHICQEYHDHCVVTTYDGKWEAWSCLIYVTV